MGLLANRRYATSIKGSDKCTWRGLLFDQYTSRSDAFGVVSQPVRNADGLNPLPFRLWLRLCAGFLCILLKFTGFLNVPSCHLMKCNCLSRTSVPCSTITSNFRASHRLLVVSSSLPIATSCFSARSSNIHVSIRLPAVSSSLSIISERFSAK